MSLPPDYFDELYAATDDPWGFESRWYEQRKYALTLAALPLARYRRAFEPGCSVGVLTAALAARCDRLTASDPSLRALEIARSRVPAEVELVEGSVPHDWPEGAFDLIICSELGYYLSGPDLGALITRVEESLEPEGHLIAVHWRPQVADYPTHGALVHERFGATFRSLAHYEDEFVLLDVFGGAEARLVAPD